MEQPRKGTVSHIRISSLADTDFKGKDQKYILKMHLGNNSVRDFGLCVKVQSGNLWQTNKPSDRGVDARDACTYIQSKPSWNESAHHCNSQPADTPVAWKCFAAQDFVKNTSLFGKTFFACSSCFAWPWQKSYSKTNSNVVWMLQVRDTTP